MKSLFMEKSRLRIICLDSKKLLLNRSDSMRSGLSFSNLSPERIDVVVTNRPLLLHELPKDATDEQKNEVSSSAQVKVFKDIITIINNRGIPCLVARRGPTPKYHAPVGGFGGKRARIDSTEKVIAPSLIP